MGPFEKTVESRFSGQDPQNFPRLLARYVSETQGISLQEAARRSLARVFTLFTDVRRNAAIMTAFRGEYGYAENLTRNRRLMQDLRMAGYGYVPVIGGFVETTEDGGKREVEEESLVVSGPVTEDTPGSSLASIGAFQRTLLLLCRKYDQDGVLLKLAGSLDVVLLEKSGSSMTLGPWRLNAAAKYYTKMRFGAQAGQKMEFTFECAGDDTVSTRRVVEAHFSRNIYEANFKKTTFQVVEFPKSPAERVVEWPCFASTEHPGLCFTTEKPRSGRGHVYHMPSGKKLCPHRSPAEAQAIIAAIGPETNWSVPANRLPSEVLNSLRELIDPVMEKFGGVFYRS